MTTHTLAAGTTVASQYGAFGISNRRMIPPPGRLFGFAVGHPGAGKTNLFAYNPAALILNCDTSSTPMPTADAPPPTAQFVPGFDTTGRTIDAAGNVIVMSWAFVEDIKAKLIDAAINNRPRPETVVLDSVPTAIGLLRSWLVSEEKKKPGRTHVKDWSDLHGEAAWELLYGTLLKFAADLRPYYGVWFTGHLTEKIINENGTDKRVQALTTPPGFMPRFYPLFELCVGIEARTTMEERNVTKVLVIEGKSTPITDKVQVPTKKSYLIGESVELAKVAKRRIALPLTLELPPLSGWQTFCEAYNKAAQMPVASAA